MFAQHNRIMSQPNSINHVQSKLNMADSNIPQLPGVIQNCYLAVLKVFAVPHISSLLASEFI